MSELPVTLIQSIERRLVTSVSAQTSPFTGSQQIQDWGGEWWEVSFDVALTKGREGRRLSAVFTALGGMRGWFVLRDPSMARPDLTQSITVSGAGQQGNTLLTSGWGADAPALEAGDFFSIGTGRDMRLHQILEDAVADVSGAAVLRVTPRLRAASVDLSPVEVAAPGIALRLTAPVPTRISRADSFRFSVTARQAL
ncbi:hypothetical protein SAMN04490248_12039 [Salinihabitans flavidus]|uniref:Uncharacterized protein n=1 Tax=Salinihabitans flavidus TaxID=569882 RepID=A0A1H8UI82_9RHOB|nr:hypothetical protein [Salinihabitans flavidus]SEP02940.1 hypothetical protein SAMN04490248_12039 [Salinihabitans flavidus]